MASFWLFKIYPQLDNPVVIIFVIAIVALIGFYAYKKSRGDIHQKMKVFYFADLERLVSPLDVTKLTSSSVLTKGDKKFWRRSKSWLWKHGNEMFVVFLGKVGKGVTYRLETNKRTEDGKVQLEKLGSLYEGVISCLDVKEANELTPQTFTPESLELLKKSEIFVCVDLEYDPSDVPKEFDEDNAVSDADKSFSSLVGEQIRNKLEKEDWLRNAGLMAIGATGLWLAQNLGFI